MTTTVTVHAHCADDKEVIVSLYDHHSGNELERFTLQDGEKADRVVFDGREISVMESVK